MANRTKRTKADARSALHTLLIMAVDLDRLSVDQLARTHGLPAMEIGRALDAARNRRVGV